MPDFKERAHQPSMMDWECPELTEEEQAAYEYHIARLLARADELEQEITSLSTKEVDKTS